MGSDGPARSVPFSTDAAVLAAFDPKALTHRIRHPSTWWRKQSVVDVTEVEEGRIALWPLGEEGLFAVRLGLEAEAPLADDERALVRGEVAGLGVVVESGDLFIGAAERLPGDGVGDRVIALPGTGAFLKVAPGAYAATVHVLDVRSEARFFDADGERRPDAPADFVVLLRPREGPFAPPSDVTPLLDKVPQRNAPSPRREVPAAPARATAAVKYVTREPARSAQPRSAEAPPPVRELPLEPVAPAPGPFELDLLKRAMREVVRAHAGAVGPDPRLAGGWLVLRPRDRDLQPKEIPLDDLLEKVTRCRDQLRVLEQKVNGHEGLTDEQKLDVDVLVTACYEAFVRVVGCARL